jgi:hypothetical protein
VIKWFITNRQSAQERTITVANQKAASKKGIPGIGDMTSVRVWKELHFIILPTDTDLKSNFIKVQGGRQRKAYFSL